MQRGIKRALLNLQDFARNLLDALRNPVSMHGTERHDLQDQHVQRALQQIGSVDTHARLLLDTLHVYTAAYVECQGESWTTDGPPRARPCDSLRPEESAPGYPLAEPPPWAQRIRKP